MGKKDIEQMARVSTDNGNSYTNPEQALADVPWDVIENRMDDDIREKVHYELAPCTNLEFLTRYLYLAEEDLIIG